MADELDGVVQCRGCDGLVRIQYGPQYLGHYILTCPVCKNRTLIHIALNEVENLGEPANFTVKPWAERAAD